MAMGWQHVERVGMYGTVLCCAVLYVELEMDGDGPVYWVRWREMELTGWGVTYLCSTVQYRTRCYR